MAHQNTRANVLLLLLHPQYSKSDSACLHRCDADPTVLSDYVLALLRHDEPESQLREGVQKQLSDFLESGTSSV